MSPASLRPASPRLDPASREEIRYFHPGPSYVLEDVRSAMTRPVVAHRSGEFMALYRSLADRLPAVLRTSGEVYLATGSATLMMESAVISTVDRRILCLTNGAFSERWLEICRALGKEATPLAVPWGEAIDPDRVRQMVRDSPGGPFDAVTVVHCETSTGVLNPVAEIARAVREESAALVLVDAVSSLGGAAVETEAWGLDLVVGGVHKALAMPPGLVLVTFSERLVRAAERLPHRGYYTDLLRYRDKHRSGGTITTPAVSLVYALDRQLDRVLAEGMEPRWRRHLALRQRTLEWAQARGLALAPRSHPSPTVTCLRSPAGRCGSAMVERAAARGFVLGAGYGAWKQDTFRIGHMGEVQPADLNRLLRALEE